MNLNQKKQSDSYLSIDLFLKEHSATLIAAIPGIAVNIANYHSIYDELYNIILDASTNLSGYKIDEDQQRADGELGVWKIYLAMYYHYTKANDELTSINIKITPTKLKQMKPMEFYNYWQTLFNLYVPADFIPYGITEAQINALNGEIEDYIAKFQARKDVFLNKKLLGQKLTVILKTIENYIKINIDPLVRMALASDGVTLTKYNDKRYKGFVSPTRGNPDKSGKLGPGEIVNLDKHAFRNKKAVIVINTGLAILRAGIGVTESEFTGSPFTIEPGMKRRRICQKLANEGEYILLQNIGDTETGYEVWLKG